MEGGKGEDGPVSLLRMSEGCADVGGLSGASSVCAEIMDKWISCWMEKYNRVRTDVFLACFNLTVLEV